MKIIERIRIIIENGVVVHICTKSQQFINNSNSVTLKFLINEHARLAFLNFFSTILEIFHVIN